MLHIFNPKPAAWVAWSAFAVLGFSNVEGSPSSRPNIILCVTDDQGWGDTQYNGHPMLQTPNLDAMSREGLRFNRWYAGNASVCSPSRGACLTGRSPWRYGVTGPNQGCMKSQELTLAEALKTRGYTTAHFGKWHLGSLTTNIYDSSRGGRPNKTNIFAPPWKHGFDVCFSTEANVPTWNPMQSPSDPTLPFTEDGAPTRYWLDQDVFVPTDSAELKGDDSTIMMNRVLPFVRAAAQSNTPFLAVVWFHAPHVPVVAGEPWLSMYPNADARWNRPYYACLTAMDAQVGRLRNELEILGIKDQTMFWFCSDNGPDTIGGLSGSTGGLRGRKHRVWEGGIRVPGLLVWPEMVSAAQARSVEMPCSLVDYYPTILDVLGIEMVGQPSPLDGISLMPLIEGAMTARPADRPLGFKSNKGDQIALIDNQYKIIRDGSPPAVYELYDLATDPNETTNLAAQYPEKVTSMRTVLEQWLQSCALSNSNPWPDYNLTLTDTDGDEVPDAWENLYFNGDLRTSSGRATDSDGDGVNDYDEYIAGTDPTDPHPSLNRFTNTCTTSGVWSDHFTPMPATGGGANYKLIFSNVATSAVTSTNDLASDGLFYLNELDFSNAANQAVTLLPATPGETLVFSNSGAKVVHAVGGAAAILKFNHDLRLDADTGFFSTNGGAIEVNNALGGPGKLSYGGNGILTLNGATTHGGGTTVNAGTLRVNGSASGDITAENGATLGGTGSVGSVRMKTGSTLNPGNLTGALTVANQLTLAANTNVFELVNMANHAQVAVNALEFTDSPSLSLALSNFGGSEGDVYVLFKNVTALTQNNHNLWLNGTQELPDNTQFTSAGHLFRINYDSGGGSDIALTVLPPLAPADALYYDTSAAVGLQPGNVNDAGTPKSIAWAPAADGTGTRVAWDDITSVAGPLNSACFQCGGTSVYTCGNMIVGALAVSNASTVEFVTGNTSRTLKINDSISIRGGSGLSLNTYQIQWGNTPALAIDGTSNLTIKKNKNAALVYTMGTATLTGNGGSINFDLAGTSAGGTVTLSLGDITKSGGGAFSINQDAANPTLYLLKGASGNTININTVAANDTLSISALLDSGSSVNKSGLGTLVLSAANSYSGTANVNVGTLLVNAPLTGTGTVAVATGATLGGTGSIAGAVTIAANGTLAPGVSIGSLSLASATIGGSLAIGINIEGTVITTDLLAVSGTLGLSGATLDLSINAPLTAPACVIATYGSRSGTFAAVNGLPPGYTIDYDYSGGTAIAVKQDSNGSGSFVTWATTNGVTGGPNGDSDHDGIPNLVEYALNLNPAGSAAAAGNLDGNVLSFAKRPEAVTGGTLSYAIQTSGTLLDASWTTVAGNNPALTDNATTISYTLPAGQGHIFARLLVTQVP